MQQKKPNVIIHLDVTPEESIERIKRRFVPFISNTSTRRSSPAIRGPSSSQSRFGSPPSLF